MLLTTAKTSVETTAKLFRGFGDPSRLSILDTLRNAALTVTEVVEATGM